MDDNRSLRAPILDSHPYHGFKPLETIWIVLFMVFLVVGNSNCKLYFKF